MTSKQKGIVFLTALCAVGLMLFFDGGQQKTEKEVQQDPIQIGAMLILSGDGASWGDATQKGIELAREEINAAGGILGRPIEIVYEDTQSDPKVAVSAYQKLRNLHGVDLFIGTTWSHTGMAIREQVHEDQSLMISPTMGLADVNEFSPYIFSLHQHDDILAAQLAEYVFEKHKQVAVFGAQEIWVQQQTNIFIERFQALGGKVVLLEEPLQTQKQFQTEVLKVTSNDDIEAIVLTNAAITLGSDMARALRSTGVELPFYSLNLYQDVIDAAQGAYTGMTYISSFSPTKAYQQLYEKTYHEALDIGSDTAYDILFLLKEAIEETESTDPSVLQKYVNKKTYIDGVSGYLTSDGKGAFTKDYVVKVVE